MCDCPLCAPKGIKNTGVSFKSIYYGGLSISTGYGTGYTTSGESVSITTTSRSLTPEAMLHAPPERQGNYGVAYISLILLLIALGNLWDFKSHHFRNKDSIFELFTVGSIFKFNGNGLDYFIPLIAFCICFFLIIYSWPKAYVKRNYQYKAALQHWENEYRCSNCNFAFHPESFSKIRAFCEDWSWVKRPDPKSLSSNFLFNTYYYIGWFLLSNSVFLIVLSGVSYLPLVILAVTILYILWQQRKGLQANQLKGAMIDLGLIFLSMSITASLLPCLVLLGIFAFWRLRNKDSLVSVLKKAVLGDAVLIPKVAIKNLVFIACSIISFQLAVLLISYVASNWIHIKYTYFV